MNKLAVMLFSMVLLFLMSNIAVANDTQPVITSLTSDNRYYSTFNWTYEDVDNDTQKGFVITFAGEIDCFKGPYEFVGSETTFTFPIANSMANALEPGTYTATLQIMTNGTLKKIVADEYWEDDYWMVDNGTMSEPVSINWIVPEYPVAHIEPLNPDVMDNLKVVLDSPSKDYYTYDYSWYIDPVLPSESTPYRSFTISNNVLLAENTSNSDKIHVVVNVYRRLQVVTFSNRIVSFKDYNVDRRVYQTIASPVVIGGSSNIDIIPSSTPTSTPTLSPTSTEKSTPASTPSPTSTEISTPASTPSPTSTEISTPASTPSQRSIPGFEIIYSIVGLLSVIYARVNWKN